MTDEAEIQRLLTEFCEKAEPLGVSVVRVPGMPEVVREIADWGASLGAECVILATEVTELAPEIGTALETAGFRVRPSDVPEATRDAPLGISLARLAIAETGSVLLSEPSLEDRSLGMLTLAHATLCPISSLVASLDNAVPVLLELALTPGGAFSTLITGPSRTADIERVLTVGVQGPGKVMTIFFDDL